MELTPVELAARLTRFDPRNAYERGELRWLSHNDDLRFLAERVSNWAANVRPDPRPVEPVNLLDVRPPVEPGAGGPEPVRGWTPADHALVARLATVERPSDAEIRRVAELALTAGGDQSARLLAERILEPVRQRHEAAVRAHEAAVERWEQRRPRLPHALQSEAVEVIGKLIEANTTELHPAEARHRAAVYLQNGGSADPWEAA